MLFGAEKREFTIWLFPDLLKKKKHLDQNVVYFPAKLGEIGYNQQLFFYSASILGMSIGYSMQKKLNDIAMSLAFSVPMQIYGYCLTVNYRIKTGAASSF